MLVIKRDGSLEPFLPQKIINAVRLSANRTRKKLTEEQENYILQFVEKDLKSRGFEQEVIVDNLHLSVENCLWEISRELYQEYRSYNNYKRRFNYSFNNILKDAKNVIYNGDKENANKDSCIISTKMTLVSELVGKELYLEYELPKHLSKAHKNMDFYIHDAGHRFYNGMINCCLFDIGNVLNGGFNLNGKTISEPDSLEKALDLVSDILFVASSQQYGGFTLPELDKVLKVYAEKTYIRLRKEHPSHELAMKELEEIAYKKFKSIQYKIECVNNAGGQTPFVTWTFGTDTSEFGKLISRAILKVRENHMAIFPKLVYLYASDISGPGKPNHDLYNYAKTVSIKRMYPDFLSADKGYLNEVYERCGTIISPMGCRAYLSPYFGENGKEYYIGRFNLGAISLALPRYAIMSEGDKDKFFELVDKYFDYAMQVHNLTYEKMRKAKASSNPLLFCEGGCLVKLNPNDTIEKALESATYSIGYIGLEEVCYLMTGKHLHQDNSFAIEVLEYLNSKIEKAKKETGKLIALYGTPSEGYCDKLLRADREKFGVIPGITDKDWYHNSFHVASNHKLSATDKQLLESPLFHRSNGGHIVYNEFYTVDNFEAFSTIIDHAMEQGLYYGINLELGKCNECNYEGNIFNTCPNCNSKNVAGVTRCCGYLGYKLKDGDTRYNKGKNAEVENRVRHFDIEVGEPYGC